MSKSYVFNWNPKDFDRALKSCDEDDAVKLSEKYLNNNMFILEAGAGTGRIVEYFYRKGYRIDGIEANGDIVNAIKSAHQHLNIFHGDASRMNIGNEYYDAILAYGLIEHFPDGPQDVLGEFKRVLKTGGMAIVTVPSFNKLRQRRRKIMPGDKWHTVRRGGKHYEFMFKPDEIEYECAAAGFEIIESVPLSHIDGMYHDKLGDVTHDHWQFHATDECLEKNEKLKEIPFYHNHMHGLVLKK